MTFNVQTQLLGARIEMKPRGTNDSYCSYWTDDRDSDRGELTGFVRTVCTGTDGIIIMQIEDDEGWIHTRSTSSHIFRIVMHASLVGTLDKLTNADAMISDIDREWVKRVEARRVAEHNTQKLRKLGNLMIGDRFQFVKAPPGWFDGKLVIVEQAPGWAMPEGWDFILWARIREDHDLGQHDVILLDEQAPAVNAATLPEE